MTKNNLKTLKDLEEKSTFVASMEKTNGKLGFVEIDKLKAEAVKWVKMVESGAGDGFMYMAIFKKFFNLTSEDLK